MKTISVLIVLFFLFGKVYSQQDPHFSHYAFNDIYNNPGASGIEGVSRATLLHRSQWAGYQTQGVGDASTAPQTQVLTLSHPLKIMASPVVNSGVGLMLVNDKLGPLKNITAKLSYSYHYKLRNSATLGLGARAGIYSQRIDGSLLREAEVGDVVVDQLRTSPSQIRPDVGLGAWYNSRKYYVGLSMNHVIGSQFNFGANKNDLNSRVVQHLYITGGYHIMLGTKLRITPSSIIQSDFVETNYVYGFVTDLNRYKYWLGFNIRQSITGKSENNSARQIATDDFVFMAGISLLQDKSLRIGYSFDLVTSGARAKDYTSHEFMISYVLPLNLDKTPPPLRTPRYRHEN